MTEDHQEEPLDEAVAKDNQDSAPPEEVVILVHGTFAASDYDKGDAWWQVGSPFWEKLNYRLMNSNVRVTKKPFHWNGQNTEHARWACGRRLVALFQQLEQQTKPFHVIAHSHAGNALWYALRRAAELNTPLTCLKSWATVGTPFVHVEDAVGPKKVFAKIMLSWCLLWLGMGAAFATVWGVLMLFALLHVTTLGLPTPTLTPDIVVLTVQYCVLYPLAIGLMYGIVGALVRVRATRSLLRTVTTPMAPQHMSSWLGIWSREDEAISTLRAALGKRCPIVQPIVEDREFVSSVTSRYKVIALDERGYSWWDVVRNIFSNGPFLLLFPDKLAQQTYNRYLVKRLDRFVWDKLVRNITGNTHPYPIRVADVTVAPLLKRSTALPSLPMQTDASEGMWDTSSLAGSCFGAFFLYLSIVAKRPGRVGRMPERNSARRRVAWTVVMETWRGFTRVHLRRPVAVAGAIAVLGRTG